MLSDRTILIAIFLAGLTLFILDEWFGSSRQTITVRVSNASLPVPGLILSLHVSDARGCKNSGNFYRTGSSDSAGVVRWNRPIKRKSKSGRPGRAHRDPFEALLSRPPAEKVRICAVLEDQERVIFVEEEGQRFERRLDVTCDLALKTSEKCYGTYPVSLDRTLMPFVFMPIWLLLLLAIGRSGGRPVKPDLAAAFVTGFLCALTVTLERFWLFCQVLTVAATLGVIFALAYTVSANLRFRRSKQA